jgi:hypothetical protein
MAQAAARKPKASTGLSRKESKGTTREVFCAAADFEHAAWVLHYAAKIRGHKSRKAERFYHTPGSIPLIVCMNFSVELYLKCLIRLERNKVPRRVHELETLFALVSPARQDRIKCHYDAWMAPSLEWYKAWAKKNGYPESSVDFHVILKTTSTGFKTWRYAYEREMPKGANGSYYLAYGVRQTIIELRPKWARVLTGLSIESTSRDH